MRRSLMLCAFLGLPACDGWAVLTTDDAENRQEPVLLSVLETRACPLPAGSKRKDKRIVGYRVKLRGQLASGVPANYFYASLLTTDGSRYLAELPGCAPVLSGAPLRLGESAEGFLNFPIPAAKTPQKLVYAPELIDVPSQSALYEIAVDGSAGETDEEAP